MEEQIAFALTLAELGTTIEEICRKLGTSDATFDDWKKKFGGLGQTTGATQPSRKFCFRPGPNLVQSRTPSVWGRISTIAKSGNEKRC